MPVPIIVLLGAIAGFTIFLGLPLARVKALNLQAKGFLTMLATGILFFLLADVTAKMLEPVEEALAAGGRSQRELAAGVEYSGLLVLGVFVGLVGIVLVSKRLKARSAVRDSTPSEIKPESLSLVIAVGIGAHNFSEGLAIGQAAASGALSLAWILIVGFGLHNMTEGFGIAGPLGGRTVSWKYLFLLGLIGGGPTFLGTLLGISFVSTPLFVFSLAFAAGAIVYVITELLASVLKYRKHIVVLGLFAGFILGLGTDLILGLAGA